MQADTPVQAGGVDPGLAALIAAILSGGVGAYGYSKDTRTAEDVIAERIRLENEGKFKEAEEARKAAETLNATVSKSTADFAKLQKDYDELKAKFDALQSTSASVSNYDIIFKSATPETLRAAVPLALAKLASRYTWIQPDGSNTPKLKVSLEYPATYTGRLSRMNLFDFYRKRILKALQDDQGAQGKGGIRKRRYRRRARGGASEEFLDEAVRQQQELDRQKAVDDSLMDAFESAGSPAPAPAPVPVPEPVPVPAPAPAPESIPVPPSFPTYEEFAQLYTQAIEEAAADIKSNTLTVRQQEDLRRAEARSGIEQGKRTAQEARDNKAARDAAEAMARKVSVAVDAAKKEVENQAANFSSIQGVDAGIATAKAALDSAIEEGTMISTVPPPPPLRPNTPEDAEFKKHSKLSLYDTSFTTVVPSLPAAIDTTPNWVAAWNAKRPAAEKVLEDLPRLTKNYVDAVSAAKSAQLAPAPPPLEETKPEEVVMEENPLLAIQQERQKQEQIRSELAAKAAQSKIDQEAELAAMPPTQKPKTRRREKFGGKARKRTLKKRRGGK